MYIVHCAVIYCTALSGSVSNSQEIARSVLALMLFPVHVAENLIELGRRTGSAKENTRRI